MKKLIPHLLLGVLLIDMHSVVNAAEQVAQASPSTPPASPAATDVVRFDIERFEVIGNTLLSQILVSQVLKPFTGKSRDFGDVQRALEALEAAYRARGFSVVQVELPEQELNGGVVKLRAVETKIGKILIEGNRKFSDLNIQRSLPGLREGQTPNLKNVSGSLRVANENPAKKVSLQLEGSEKEGEVNALLKVVEDDLWKFGASVDNTGTSQTGETRLGFSAQSANLFGFDDIATLQYSTTAEQPSKVSIYGFGYRFPLYALGDSIDIFGSFSDVDSGSVAVGPGLNLLVSGRGKVAGMRYNQSLARSETFEPKLNYGVDYKAFENGVLFGTTQLGNDVIVHPVSVTYSGVFTIPESEAGFSLSLARNIPGGRDGRTPAFNAIRMGAATNFSILRYTANYARLLPREWQLRLGISGQFTRDALIPGEQFGAGGSTSVRGFTEREISNDYGTQANLEIYSPNLCGAITIFPTQCRFLAFYDGARLERNKALPGEILNTTISSTGLGLRLSVDKNLSMQVDFGHVLSGSLIEKNRLHFKMNLSY